MAIVTLFRGNHFGSFFSQKTHIAKFANGTDCMLRAGVSNKFDYYTVDGMDNSLRPDVSAVRCPAYSVPQQQFLAVLSINLCGQNIMDESTPNPGRSQHYWSA